MTKEGCSMASLDVDKLRAKGNVKGLIKALGSEDAPVRRKAAQALAALKDAGAIDPLIRCLVDKDNGVRENAAKALAEIGDPRAVESLMYCLQDQDPEIRWIAAKALANFGSAVVDPLIRNLDSVDRHLAEVSAFALGETGDPRAVTPLILTLRRPDWDVRTRVEAALHRIGEPAVGPLVTYLKDNDVGTRCSAAKILGKLGDRNALDALLTCLDDESPDMRRNTIEAIGRLGDPRTLETLSAGLEDPDPGVRESAAAAIQRLKLAR